MSEFTGTNSYSYEEDYKLNVAPSIKNLNLSKIKARVTNGFCTEDVYNMDRYLLQVLPQMLRTLVKTAHPADKVWVDKLNEIADIFDKIRLASLNPTKLSYKWQDINRQLSYAFQELSKIFFTLWYE